MKFEGFWHNGEWWKAELIHDKGNEVEVTFNKVPNKRIEPSRLAKCQWCLTLLVLRKDGVMICPKCRQVDEKQTP